MCKLLNISRSSLYYAKNKPAKKYNAEEEKLTQHIKEIFKNSRNNYGSRKIKVELKKKATNQTYHEGKWPCINVHSQTI